MHNGIILPKNQETRPRPYGKRWSPTHGIGALLSSEGDILWQDSEWVPNALTDEGERDMLAVYLGQSANPSKFLCLINGTTTAPVEASTMAYLGGAAGANETQVPGSNGYNRQQVIGALGGVDWTDDGLIGGDARFSAAQKTFGPASGVAWTANHAGLVTSSTGQVAGSGKFLLYLPLSATTPVAIGQSFAYLLRWSNQQEQVYAFKLQNYHAGRI